MAGRPRTPEGESVPHPTIDQQQNHFHDLSLLVLECFFEEA